MLSSCQTPPPSTHTRSTHTLSTNTHPINTHPINTHPINTPYQHTPYQHTPYHHRFGHLDIVAYLITHGADPNRGDDHSDTPLLDACTRGHLAVVQHLVATIGVDIYQSNHLGIAALFAAAGAGHLAVVVYLVEAGCEVEGMNRHG